MWNIKVQLQEPSSRLSPALFDPFRMMDEALDENQNILKLQHRNLTGDVLQRPWWRCLLWSCSCSDWISDGGEQLSRLRNPIRTVLSQLLCYRWHVSVDDLRERIIKEDIFSRKAESTGGVKDAWCPVSRRSPWVALPTAPANRQEQGLAMQHRLQYIQDRSPEKETVWSAAPSYYTSSYFTVQEEANVSNLFSQRPAVYKHAKTSLHLQHSGQNYKERRWREDRTLVVNKYTSLAFVRLFCTVAEDDINTRE